MPTFSRTRTALRVHDAAIEALFATETQADADRALVALDVSERAVRAAFADDTSDRNRRDVAMLAPVEWVRALMEVA